MHGESLRIQRRKTIIAFRSASLPGASWARTGAKEFSGADSR